MVSGDSDSEYVWWVGILTVNVMVGGDSESECLWWVGLLTVNIYGGWGF